MEFRHWAHQQAWPQHILKLQNVQGLFKRYGCWVFPLCLKTTDSIEASVRQSVMRFMRDLKQLVVHDSTYTGSYQTQTRGSLLVCVLQLHACSTSCAQSIRNTTLPQPTTVPTSPHTMWADFGSHVNCSIGCILFESDVTLTSIWKHTVVDKWRGTLEIEFVCENRVAPVVTVVSYNQNSWF